MISLNWADAENKLLIWQFSQRWSRCDFLIACQKSQHMMKSVDHPVNVLIDLSKSRFYPSNLMYLAYAGMQMKSKNTGSVMVVSESQLWSRLYHHLTKIYSIDSLSLGFVTSLDEAMKGLQSLVSDDRWATT